MSPYEAAARQEIYRATRSARAGRGRQHNGPTVYDATRAWHGRMERFAEREARREARQYRL